MKASYAIILYEGDAKRAGGRHCVTVYFDDEPVEAITMKAAEAVEVSRMRIEG